MCWNKFFDKNGNRVSGIDRDVTFEAEFDQQDRLVVFNDTTFTYNLNGTLATSTTDSVTTTYSFDVFGNLVYISKTGLAVGYTYDGHNRRFEKYLNSAVAARYVWESQLRLAAVMNPDNSIKQQFVYADGVNSPEYMVYLGKRYHFVKDYRGSILKVVDADSGEVVQRLTYSEFGEVLDDSNPGFQPFGFAGGLYDHDTKLVKFGARDYDGRIGRWLSKDPIRFEGGDENLFGYVENDPINSKDPFGLMILPETPTDLPRGWDIDPTHKDPNGTRWRYKGSDRCLDFHKGRSGQKGYKGKDHWHDSENPKEHLKPGDEVPDPNEPSKRYFWDGILPPVPLPVPVPVLV